jgi:hypothetical protein
LGWAKTKREASHAPGTLRTVKMAGLLTMLRATLVKTASYRLPFCAAAAVKVSVVEVAPLTGA